MTTPNEPTDDELVAAYDGGRLYRTEIPVSVPGLRAVWRMAKDGSPLPKDAKPRSNTFDLRVEETFVRMSSTPEFEQLCLLYNSCIVFEYLARTLSYDGLRHIWEAGWYAAKAVYRNKQIG